MKVLIFSDSHGNIRYMQRAIDIHCDCDYVVHLGDGASDADYLVIPKNAVYIGVRGNCDVYSDAPAELTESFGKVKKLLCHGHNYFVKSSLAAYEVHAIALGVSVALYGHTHERYLEYRNGIGCSYLFPFQDSSGTMRSRAVPLWISQSRSKNNSVPHINRNNHLFSFFC